MADANAPTGDAIHAVLVAGYWLGGWAWRDVEPPLQTAGITTHAVTLPGMDGTASTDVTLDDHIAAVVELVDELRGAVVLVGHSGGALVVQGAADRRAERIARVIYVDSGPLQNGAALRPDATADLPLPSWEELTAEQSSIEGIDDEMLAEFRRRAVSQPAGVARSPLRLTNDARLDVPATVICTSLACEAFSEMVAAGQFPTELPSVRDVRCIDLPTGHWPMFSRPYDLANALRDEIQTTGRSPQRS
ncbi:MAG: alpha/beta fold hydrolase [Acidimicrobiales bacterium]